ncbi:hypothetical protein CPB84DRAFT_1852152 [Gymnopilus junonius]|uniref:Uncharacterized protein n=1 Tax=Gymnopilus junonius TaxID=109634 RepID=A0A9P5NCR2_GYMJU|nr:hypothetical protein CPB84DRAFT_1852152 [Gymnopilus junonius]
MLNSTYTVVHSASSPSTIRSAIMSWSDGKDVESYTIGRSSAQQYAEYHDATNSECDFKNRHNLVEKSSDTSADSKSPYTRATASDSSSTLLSGAEEDSHLLPSSQPSVGFSCVTVPGSSSNLNLHMNTTTKNDSEELRKNTSIGADSYTSIPQLPPTRRYVKSSHTYGSYRPPNYDGRNTSGDPRKLTPSYYFEQPSRNMSSGYYNCVDDVYNQSYRPGVHRTRAGPFDDFSGTVPLATPITSTAPVDSGSQFGCNCDGGSCMTYMLSAVAVDATLTVVNVPNCCPPFGAY